MNLNPTFLKVNKAVLLLLAAGAVSAAFGGCGGGSSYRPTSIGSTGPSGPTGPTGPSSVTLNGTLDGLGGTPLTGYTVYYDQGTAGQQSTVTGSTGGYTFTLTVNSITGSDTLAFYAPSGELAYTESITVSAYGSTTVPTTVVTPPTEPTTTQLPSSGTPAIH